MHIYIGSYIQYTYMILNNCLRNAYMVYTKFLLEV